MTDMSMGQRIAVQRKLKSLSQEALAEQLEVSRQAVSKWESDASIPEIDKLIALGKFFGVSVGWLLGTETNTPDEVHPSAPEKETEAPSRIRFWILLLLCSAIILALGLWKSRTTKADMEGLREQVNQLSNALETHLDESTLLTEASFTAKAIRQMRKAEVTFYFTPKLYQKAYDAYLVIRYDDSTTSFVDSTLCEWTGSRYTCTVRLDRLNGYSYSFLLVNDSGFHEQDLLSRGLAEADVIVNIDENMGLKILP